MSDGWNLLKIKFLSNLIAILFQSSSIFSLTKSSGSHATIWCSTSSRSSLKVQRPNHCPWMRIYPGWVNFTVYTASKLIQKFQLAFESYQLHLLENTKLLLLFCCSRHFANEEVREEHYRSKRHKKRYSCFHFFSWLLICISNQAPIHFMSSFTTYVLERWHTIFCKWFFTVICVSGLELLYINEHIIYKVKIGWLKFINALGVCERRMIWRLRGGYINLLVYYLLLTRELGDTEVTNKLNVI